MGLESDGMQFDVNAQDRMRCSGLRFAVIECEQIGLGGMERNDIGSSRLDRDCMRWDAIWCDRILCIEMCYTVTCDGVRRE